MEAQQIIIGGHYLIGDGRVVGGKAILVGRTMEVTKPSKVAGMVNGQLVNPKNGKLQKTEISIPLELLTPIAGQQLEEVV